MIVRTEYYNMLTSQPVCIETTKSDLVHLSKITDTGKRKLISVCRDIGVAKAMADSFIKEKV